MADGHGISIFDKLKQGLTIIATPLLKPSSSSSTTTAQQPKSLKVEKSIRSSTSGVTVSLASNCSKTVNSKKTAVGVTVTASSPLPPQKLETSITPVLVPSKGGTGSGNLSSSSGTSSTSSSSSSSSSSTNNTTTKKCAKKAENECATTLLKKTTSKDDSKESSSSSSVEEEESPMVVDDDEEDEYEEDDDNNSSPTEDGNRRKKQKKKRCSDRYDSSESSDSGVATSLSCTDSSTASSDTSDPGSPFSSGSPTEDVHRKLGASKMSANTELITITPIHDTNKKQQQTATTKSSQSWTWGKTNGGNKRVSNDLTNATTQAKKTRTILPNGPLINTIGGVTVTPVGPSSGRRQTKQSLAEESQTKITGYFKAQMKLANKNKEKQLLPPQEQNTTANLNKFFNVLKKNCDNDQQRENNVLSALTSSNSSSLDMIPIKNSTPLPTSSAAASVSTPSVPSGTTITPIVNNSKNLKKNTKIAQVAPNLRKPAAQTNGSNKMTTPQKKHVAIAPRTAEILPKIQPQIQPQAQQPQPTVLLTAIRLPTQPQIPSQPQALVPTSTTISYQLPGSMGHFVTIPNNNQPANAANIVLNNGQLTRMAGTPTSHAPQFFFGNGGTFFKFQHMQQMQQFSSTTTTTGATTVANTQNLIMKTTRQQQMVQTSQQQVNQQIVKPRNPQQPILIPMAIMAAGTTTMPALQPINNGAGTQFLPNQQPQLTTIQPPQSSPQPPPLAFTGPAAKMGISSSEPPPLVTISSNKPVAQLSSNNIENEQKIPPLVPRFQPQVRVISTASLLKSPTTNSAASITTSNGSPSSGKITSSEPPSLIPTPRIPPFSINEKQEKDVDEKSNCCELLEIKEESKVVFESIKDVDLKEELDKPKLLDFEIKKETPETLLLFQDEASISSTIQSSTLSSTVDTIESNIKESIAMATAEFLSSPTPTLHTPPEIDTSFTEESSTNKSAISPILSQPKTIRFPALNGGARGVKRRHDGICYWENCNIKHESVSKLVDHLHTKHVVTQNGPFSCLWVGCRVYGSESCSRRWLERHVASYHGSSKEFKCIVDGCGLRFATQLTLQKHVNQHFNAMDIKEGSSKRTSDPPVPKQLKKNGKKLKYRRTPFSARLFDFFDSFIMEGLDNRLIKMSKVTNLMSNSMTFTGRVTMTRKTFAGTEECLIKWSPPDIISDEWVPKKTPAKPFTKTVKLKSLKQEEKAAAEHLIQSTYRQNIQRPKEPACLDILKEMEATPTASNATQNDTYSVKVSGSKRRKQYHDRISTS